MPYVRKSNVVRKSRTSKKPKSFATRVRRVITGAAQTKHSTNSVDVGTVAGNTNYIVSPTQNIAAGTDIRSRLGDQVKLHKLKLNGYYVAPNIANANIKIRVSVFYSSIKASAAAVQGTGITEQDLFLPNSYVGNAIVGMYDDKAVQLLADVTMDVNSLVSTSQDVKSFAMEMYLKDIRMNYIDSGSAFGETKNLYVYFRAWGAGGLAPVNVGSMFFTYDLQFKDI